MKRFRIRPTKHGNWCIQQKKFFGWDTFYNKSADFQGGFFGNITKLKTFPTKESAKTYIKYYVMKHVNVEVIERGV